MSGTNLRRSLLTGLLSCAAGLLPLFAQTAPVTTSSPYEPEMQVLVLEAKVDLAAIKVPGGLPAALTGLVSSGLVEFRARIDNYDPVARTARTTLFITPPSTPLPAPSAAVPGPTDQTMISQNTLRCENLAYLKATSAGTPGIQVGGRFTNFLGGALAVPPGTPFVFTFAYPAAATAAGGASSAQFAELSFVIAGGLNLYAPAPAGSITVVAAASN